MSKWIMKAHRYLSIARVTASSSSDPQTHVGAVVVGPDLEIRSTGYNGLPRGFDDTVEERLQAPEKYRWMVHAELNSILNAVRVGVSLKGCAMYVTLPPCFECAKAIIQTGISTVIVDEHLADIFRKNINEKQHNLKIAEKMLYEGKVTYVEIPNTKNNPNKVMIGGKLS